jgi:hypothetical protein
MASKFQKREFPIEKLATFLYITVVSPDGSIIDIEYNDLKLIEINNQLAYSYKSDDGDLIMPIARKGTIEKIFSKNA